MKKIFAFVALSLLLATSSFAVDTIDASTTIGTLDFSPSNNVSIKVASNDNTGTPSNTYTAVSFHGSGSRMFATDESESKIYWLDAPAGTSDFTGLTVSATAPDLGAAGSDWLAM